MNAAGWLLSTVNSRSSSNRVPSSVPFGITHTPRVSASLGATLDTDVVGTRAAGADQQALRRAPGPAAACRRTPPRSPPPLPGLVLEDHRPGSRTTPRAPRAPGARERRREEAAVEQHRVRPRHGHRRRAAPARVRNAARCRVIAGSVSYGRPSSRRPTRRSRAGVTGASAEEIPSVSVADGPPAGSARSTSRRRPRRGRCRGR